MPFNEIFGGNAIYPADPTFLNLALTADVVFQWPLEQSMAGPTVLASEIEVTPDAGGHSVFMPLANQGSTGYTTTFYNAGAFSFTIKDSTGATLGVVTSGTAWTLWLRDNSTPAGLWRVFQMGAATSSANAAALAGAGLKAISTTLNQDYETSDHAVNYVIVNADRAVVQSWTGGAGVLTLPDPAAVGEGWFVPIKNNGSGSVSVAASSGTVDGSASISLDTLDSAFFVSDGTNFYTVGLGQSINSVFDFISMDVSGSGDLVLSGSQLNRISYEFTGLLSGNRGIVVPASIQQYWIDNETTGPFTLVVKAAGGDPGVLVQQGARTILYCDGTNIVTAQTFNSLTFSSGTAAAPGIAFTTNPGTGIYNAAGALGLSTGGVSRGVISTNGNVTLEAAGTGTAATLVVKKRLSGGGQTGLQVLTDGDASTTPGIHIASQGPAMICFTADSGTLGTNDFRIFQQTGTRSVSLINASAAAGSTMTLTTLATANNAINLNSGNVNCASFIGNAVGGNAIIGISTNPDSVGFRTVTQSTVGAAGGASALPATPLGYMTVTVNGASVKIPYYNP